MSRVFSSAINLLLSLIPLLAVMLLTGTPIRPAILLLPFGLICLVGFCIGMGFILSTLMVFFRDTQFLWGVVSMLWMYVSPEPKAYALCLIASFVPLIFGAIIFKKNQDKFILNL